MSYPDEPISAELNAMIPDGAILMSVAYLDELQSKLDRLAAQNAALTQERDDAVMKEAQASATVANRRLQILEIEADLRTWFSATKRAEAKLAELAAQNAALVQQRDEALALGSTIAGASGKRVLAAFIRARTEILSLTPAAQENAPRKESEV